MTVLDNIIAYKKEEIKGLEATLENKIPETTPKRNFLEAFKPDAISFEDVKAEESLEVVEKKETIHVLAEIKRSSPSQGTINRDIDIVEMAIMYEENGASAISVLTDSKYFSGSLEDLQAVSKAVNIPVLRKDFILEKSQILEARLYGAHGVLLMVSVLKYATVISSLRKYAESLGMHCLVEAHSEAEVEIALKSGAKIVGVNARDFTDLSIDLGRLPPLLEKIPSHVIKIAESGIQDERDVRKIKPYADAILVGTSLMREGIEKAGAKIQSFKNA